MKYPNLLIQNDRYPAAFALRYLGAELQEQRFDVTPLNIRACRVSENQMQRALVLPLHLIIVP